MKEYQSSSVNVQAPLRCMTQLVFDTDQATYGVKSCCHCCDCKTEIIKCCSIKVLCSRLEIIQRSSNHIGRLGKSFWTSLDLVDADDTVEVPRSNATYSDHL